MRATALDIAAGRPSPPRRSERRRARLRRVRPFAASLGVAFLLLTAVQLLSAGRAEASPLSLPSLNPLGPILGGLGGIIGGGAAGIGASLAVKGFVAILNSLFSGLEAHITLQILTWLTSSANQTGGRVAVLYNLTSGIAIGLLGAVLTASFLRYWLAGLSLSGRGGFEALEGLLRTLAAVLGLLCWPFVFDQVVSLGNICSATILHSPSLRSDIAHLINAVVFVTFKPDGGLGLFVSIVLAIVGAVLFLGLLFTKVLSGAALTFLYVAMPIAIILWPVEELAWLARHAARTFMSLVLIPVVWALTFATFAAMSLNALEFQGAKGFINQVTQPLVAIAMLWLCVSAPRTLLRMATSGVGRHGGGFVSHAGSYLAARQAGAFLAERGLLPAGPGGFLSAAGSEAEAFVMPSGSGSAVDGSWVNLKDLAREEEDDAGAGESDAGAAWVVAEEMASGAGGVAAGAAAGPVGGAAAAGAVVTTAAGSAIDAAAGAVERDGTAASSSGAGPDQVPDIDAAGPTTPPGVEPATTPSIGEYRPERDHHNPVDVRPADTDQNRPALEAALAQAHEWPAPDPGAAITAFRKLGPDTQASLQEAYDRGSGENAQAVKLEAARLSISDEISNFQATDLMTVARAAAHDQAHWALGREAPQRGAAAPTPGPSSPTASPSSPPTPPQITEPSPSAAERDEQWRQAGPSVQPHID